MLYQELKNLITAGQNVLARSKVSALYNKQDRMIAMQLLKEAVLEGNLFVIKFLVRTCNLDVNAPIDKWGNKVMPLADNGAVVQILIQSGADIKAQGLQKEIALHNAKNIDAAKLFLNEDNINQPNLLKQTPLHKAVIRGNAKLVKFLLEKGADATLVDRNNSSALHFATNIEIVNLLVQDGLDINEQNKKGQTILHLTKSHSLIKYLVAQKGAKTEIGDAIGKTALHYAFESYSKKKIARALLEVDADIYSKDNQGRTPLHKIKASDLAKFVFRLFPELGAETIDAKDNTGKTPLQYQIDSGNKAIAILFVKAGADAKQKGTNGKSLLHLAHNAEVVELLAKKGVDIAAVDENGKNALYDALLNGRTQVAELLFEKGVTVSAAEKKELLNNAVVQGHLDTTKFLIRKGANINQVDESDKSLLYLSLENHKLEIAEFLKSKGLLISVADKDALMLHAINENAIELLMFMINAGANVNLRPGGNSLLYNAIIDKKEAVIEILQKLGKLGLNAQELSKITRKAIDDTDQNLLHLLLEKFELDLNKASYDGTLYLERAVKTGNYNMIQILLIKGAKPELLDIEELFNGTLMRNDVQVAKWLIAQNIKLDFALSLAVTKGNVPITKELIVKGANVLQLDGEGNNLLKYAANHNVAEVLIKARPTIQNQGNNSLDKILHNALQNDKRDVADWLVNKMGLKLTPEYTDKMLKEAIIKGHKKTAEFLIKNGAHVNLANSADNPLHLAAKGNNSEIIKVLIKSGANIKQEDNIGKMALDYVGKNQAGQILAYEFIKKTCAPKSAVNFSKALSKIQDINAKDENGYTLLMHTAMKGDLNTLNQLLGFGADVKVTDNNSKTPLYNFLVYCTSSYTLDIKIAHALYNRGARLEKFDIKYLAENAARYAYSSYGGKDVINFMKSYLGLNIRETDILHHSDRLENTQYLVSIGADVNKLDSLGHSTLYNVLYRHYSYQPSEIFTFLLGRGARIKPEEQNFLLCKASSIPTSKGGQKIVQQLISRGCDIRKANVLSSVCDLEMAKYLVGRGADIHNGDPLYNAAYTRSDASMVKFFLSRGLKFKAAQMKTFLQRGGPDLVEVLVKKGGIDINLAPVLNGVKKIVDAQRLLNLGADITKASLNPYYSEAFKYLVGHGAVIDEKNIATILINAATYGKQDAMELAISKFDISKACVLHCARDVKMAKWLVQKGAKVNAIDAHGKTALNFVKKIEIAKFLISIGGKVEAIDTSMKNAAIIKLLIAAGAKVDTLDDQGHSLLYHAAQSHEPELVRLFLDHGLTFDEEDLSHLLIYQTYGGYAKAAEVTEILRDAGGDIDGTYMLHKSMQRSYMQIIKWLLENVKDINAPDDQGNNPMHYAAASHHTNIVHLAYNNGCKFAKKDHVKFLEDYAARGMHYRNVIEILLKAGADIKQACVLHKSAHDIYMIEWLIANGANINLLDAYGKTALFQAVTSGKLDIVKFFVSKGANIKHIDPAGKTALFQAVTNGKIDIVKFLVSKGSNIKHVDKSGKDVLYYAASSRKVDVVKYLLSQGLKFAEADKKPLLQSVLGDKEMTEMLVGHGADLKQCTVTYFGDLAMIKWLVRNGADINYSDYYGNKLLYHAITSKQPDIIQFAFSQGVKLTPELKTKMLTHAINTQNVKVVDSFISRSGVDVRNSCKLENIKSQEVAKLLISRGVNVKSIDEAGNNALYHAFFNCQFEFAEFYLQKGLRLKQGNFIPLLERNYNQPKIIELLIKQGADISKAFMLGHADFSMAQWLISKGADVNVVDAKGKNALYYAIKKSSYKQQIMDYYIDKKLKLSKNDLSELLKIKVKSGYLQMVSFLEKLGADVMEGFLLKEAPNPDTAKYLINKGVLVDQLDEHGNSALHMALQKRRYPLAEFLVKKVNSDILLHENDKGKTPLHLANDKKQSKIAELILNKAMGVAPNVLEIMEEREEKKEHEYEQEEKKEYDSYADYVAVMCEGGSADHAWA